MTSEPVPPPVLPSAVPEIKPVEQTSPSDTGSSTTEYKLARAAGIVGAILTGAIATFAGLKEQMPDEAWIASAAAILGALAAGLLPIVAYITGRPKVKVAQLQVQAATALAAANDNGKALVKPNP